MSSIRKCRILSINNLVSVFNSTIPKPLHCFILRMNYKERSWIKDRDHFVGSERLYLFKSILFV